MKSIALALLFAGAAQGGGESDIQWAPLFTSPNGSVTSYAPASVRRSEGKARARIHVVLAPGISEAREFLATDEIDCGKRTRRTIELTATLEGGAIQNVRVPGTASPINPNTAMAALYEIVCAPATID